MNDQVITVEEGWAIILESKLFGPYNSKSLAERIFAAHKVRADMHQDEMDALIREDRPE